jgi:murein L,D-transpeptidase YcbB/YkuD
MRKHRFDRLLAGTILATFLAAPTPSIAAPDRVDSARPLPPLNAQTPHREPTAISPQQDPVMEPAPATMATGPAPREADNNYIEARGLPDRALAANDAQITGRLRDMIAGKQFDRRIDRAPDRKAVEAYYAAHGYAPIWIRDGRLTARAKTVIARLKNAAADGLDAADYPVPDFVSLNGAEALADSDVRLTDSMLTFARHLATGHVAPTRVTTDVDYGHHVPDPNDVLKKIADARDADAALESYNPPHEGFRALKEKLADLRRNGITEPVAPYRIPDGAVIKPGAKDARVPQLRARLGVRGKAGDLTYDKALVNAVKAAQHRADLKPTGLVDIKTLAVINGPKPVHALDRVLANMERWRWLPRDLGRAYVMVNIPDYTLKVVHDHDVVWRTKIVAGKPQTPTPLVTAPMDNVIVNPSWYVPQSIIQNELLPLYASDPNIFDRMGLEVKRGPDGNINVVQPPGAANALGRIKFAFPNKFQVYLHDTPEKRLFAYEKRAFSHGCMRVEDPTKFGEVIMHLAMSGPTPNSRQIYAMFGQDEKNYKLANRPMVHLTYQTAFVDDAGKLQLRDDIYGFDARIRAILHSDERRIADVAPPQDPKRDLATAKSNQEILRRVERREAQNPFVFFDKLFR